MRPPMSSIGTRLAVGGLSLAAVAGCASGGADAAAPHRHAVVQQFSTDQEETASVAATCFTHITRTSHEEALPTWQTALQRASVHLLPQWTDYKADFTPIGTRAPDEFFMRSGASRADVVALRHSTVGWTISATGHC